MGQGPTQEGGELRLVGGDAYQHLGMQEDAQRRTVATIAPLELATVGSKVVHLRLQGGVGV